MLLNNTLADKVKLGDIISYTTSTSTGVKKKRYCKIETIIKYKNQETHKTNAITFKGIWSDDITLKGNRNLGSFTYYFNRSIEQNLYLSLERGFKKLNISDFNKEL